MSNQRSHKGGAIGDHREVFAIHPGSFGGYRLHRKTR
jgi:hypothetical protein